MQPVKTGKSRAAGSKSSRIKEYQLKDESKEDSSIEMLQTLASLKGSNSTETTNNTTIKGIT